ncbi:TIGR00725 family protein [Geitlerinema sp. PCC 9228]|uniref:TIGR00725 family protein n=1 Tax=Geitlerinema sp. PCC 9228 TaxID=111611 RepID=UPI0008F9C907|nr:TIGR00725 family protein [Geitlerinema sp. PCC 9228]
MRKTVIGVMGPGNGATTDNLESAYELGKYIAQEGWILLTGGRNVGVMDAASRGAKEANGIAIGILPDESEGGVSEAVDIAIFTGMGNARNNINVLSSHAIVACGIGTGTTSEIALALKADKPVILLNKDETCRFFFQKLSKERMAIAETPEHAIEVTKRFLAASR